MKTLKYEGIFIVYFISPCEVRRLTIRLYVKLSTFGGRFRGPSGGSL